MSQDPYTGPPYPGVPNPNVPGPDPAPPQPPTQPFTPVFAQPGYPPPAYGQQPGPPPAGYSQPGYPPPGFPPPGHPQAAFPPPKKSWTLPIVLVSVAIVLVLCIGGLFVAGVLADRGGTRKAAATITVVEPVTLGGRPKMDSAEFADITKTMKGSLLKSYPGATRSVGAFYGVPARKNMVMAIGVAAPIPNPKLELDKNFTNLTLTGLTAENVTEVDAGPLGGRAKCGDSSMATIDVALCVWTDDGSVGVFFWYYSSKSAAEKEFVSLRSQIEQRG